MAASSRAPNLVALLALMACFMTWARSAGAWPERDPADAAHVAEMRNRAPHAAQLLEQGERLAAAGSLEEALRLFQQGETEDPIGVGFFGRRECEVLTSLNRRAEAQSTCWRAMQSERTQAVIAATVRALVSGSTAPSFDDVSQALNLLAVERTRAQSPEPRLVAAMCEVAKSIGDGIMLQQCTAQLERIAPDYPPTRRARATLEALCPPWRFWGGWLAILAASTLTLGHALRRRLRRGLWQRAAASAAGPTTAALMAILAFSGNARADLPPAPQGSMLSVFPIDDHDPEGHVPSQEALAANPLQAGYFLQDLVFKAEIAAKHGDHAAAIKYYRAMYKAVPGKALSLRYLCNEYEITGQLEYAANACAQALLLDGLMVNDYVHFVRLMLRKPGTLTPKEVSGTMNVIKHVQEADAGREIGMELECELGARVSDKAKLRECTAALAKTAPNDPKTIGYEWNLAMVEGNLWQAQRLLNRAKEAGVAADRLNGMNHALDEATRHQRKAIGLIVAGLLAIAGAVWFGLSAARGRRRRVPLPA